MKRILAGLILALAAVAGAQTTVPGGGGGGTPSSTITNGVTDTSGCVAGGVLRSISNLVDCGAGFTAASGVVGIGTASATSGAIRIFNSGHAFYTELTIGTQAGNLSYVLPTALGSAGDVLTDAAGDGVLSWETPAAGSVTTTALKDATYCVSATGTDAYGCTLATAPANLAAMEGVVVSFLADVANTTAATVAFNGFAATPIVKVGLTASSALVTGDIRAGDIVTVRLNAAGNFLCLSCDGSRASIAVSQTWSTSQTMSNDLSWSFASASSNGNIRHVSAMTPDTMGLMTGTLSNAYHVYENGDVAFDMGNCAAGTAAATNPQLCVHSATQDQTQYTSIGAGFVASKLVKALTESAATSTFQLPVAALTGSGGEFKYCVHANDATDIQERCASIRFSVVNKAGTETCNMTAVAGTDDASITETEDGSGTGSISTGTLTYAITCDTTPANAIAIQINAVSSLTQTTLEARYSVYLTGPGQILPQ